MTHVGVIGGGGWLAGALLRPALADGVLAAGNLTLSSRRGQVAGFEAWPGIEVTSDNQALADRSDIVILSVRPADVAALSLDLAGKLVISVMASVTAARIGQDFGAERIVRAMPNACAEQRLSFTPWFATDSVTEADTAFVEALFSASGKAARIPSEAQIDYFTGLTGSGVAFPALMAEIMIRHAIESGIDAATSDAAVRQVMLGAGHAISSSSASAADIVREFVDYRGTTAAGIDAARRNGIDASIAAGLDAAWAKAAGR